MTSITQFNIKNRSYYFFSDMINITNFDPNLLNVDKILFKSTDAIIYNITCITINIDNENPLYLIFRIMYMDTLKKVMEKVMEINT